MRVARASVRLRPVNSLPVNDRPPLARNLEVRVMAARRGDYRVWLPDGTVGLLRPQDLGPLMNPEAPSSVPRARPARPG